MSTEKTNLMVAEPKLDTQSGPSGKKEDEILTDDEIVNRLETYTLTDEEREKFSKMRAEQISIVERAKLMAEDKLEVNYPDSDKDADVDSYHSIEIRLSKLERRVEKLEEKCASLPTAKK